MDANIKTAASMLRNASANLQNRIRQLQADETNIHYHESQEERNIRGDLVQTGVRLAQADENTGNAQFLVKRTMDLRKRSRQIKDEADRKVAAEEREIRSLQGQIAKLNDIARTLEMWH